MKYLRQYIEESQTKAFNDAGAFFAFSQDQFNEQAKPGIKYAALGAGLICPVKNVETLNAALDESYQAGIKQDLAENGAKAIIQRELSNHESQLSGPEMAFRALDGYGFSVEELQTGWREYLVYCRENDLY